MRVLNKCLLYNNNILALCCYVKLQYMKEKIIKLFEYGQFKIGGAFNNKHGSFSLDVIVCCWRLAEHPTCYQLPIPCRDEKLAK